MRIIQPDTTMIELLFTLPDEQLADIMIEHPEIIQSMCIGLSLELQGSQNEKHSSYRRKLC